MQKAARKKAYYSKNDKILKSAKMAILHVGYSKAKRPFLERNLKVPKSQKKDSRNTLKLFYAENGSKTA